MNTVKYTINKADVISTLRNWAITNTVILAAYLVTIQTMLVEWNFNFVEIRKMLVMSLSSLILFFIKRFFLGTSNK